MRILSSQDLLESYYDYPIQENIIQNIITRVRRRNKKQPNTSNIPLSSPKNTREYLSMIKRIERDQGRNSQAYKTAMGAFLQSKSGKQNINAEFELWINSLINEGYDLSDYTWDNAYELYESYSDYLDLQSFLINEGYADSIQESDYMIEHMDEKLIAAILN